MIIRDKIDKIVSAVFLHQWHTEGIADAIIAVLPDYDDQQARIAELEAALRSILQIPNSEAAQGIMKAFAEDALGDANED